MMCQMLGHHRPSLTRIAPIINQQRCYASKHGHPLLRGMLGGIVDAYFARCSTGTAVMDLLATLVPQPSDQIYYDHFAFRTFNTQGLGIASLAQTFEHFGYQQRDRLVFENKHLEAYWYAPPNGDPALPRIFISQLQVEKLSPLSQSIILRYTKDAHVGPYSVVGSLTGALPWSTPTLQDFETLSKESEYAAWTLTNGYALNHTTISVHRLPNVQGIQALNTILQEAGFVMNAEGGVLKVSPDGGLLQSSTVADMIMFEFADGQVCNIPGPYMEFAERLVLKEYEGVEKVEENQRREGFEVGNADKIFESTSLAREGGQ